MNDREIMQQALEALEEYSPMPIDGPWHKRHHKAIDALRTAIAEAEKQEPRCAVIVEVFGKDWRLDYMSLPVGKHRLYTQEYVYTTPTAAQSHPLTDEQQDAQRYRHIKSMARARSLDVSGNHYWHMNLLDIRGPSLDEAIDRAIRARSKE